MSRSNASLTARDLTITMGPRVLLADAQLVVSPGDRVGLIGPNGSGKSTLLRCLAGLHRPERGEVRLAPGDATIGYFPQETAPRPGETVSSTLARRTGISAAHDELQQAAADLAAGNDDGAPGADRYSMALDRWLRLGGADLHARAAATLADLGLATRLLDQEVSSLSGGQAARVQLAVLLLARFDVFLLDEPTNDLDLPGLERLEQLVVTRHEPMVLVSHDRAFLQRTVTAVVEVDDRSFASAPPTLTRYEGGWQSYLDERATRRRNAQDDHVAYLNERKALVERVQRQRAWASRGERAVKRSGERDKHIRHRHTQGAHRMAARARRTGDALSRLEPVVKPWEGWDLRMKIAGAERSSEEVAALADAVVELPGTDGEAGFRLGPVTCHLYRGDRVAVVGANGSGKSTLLGALLGRIPLAAGHQHLGRSVVVGEVSQGRDGFAGATSLLEGFVRNAGVRQEDEARSALAKFGLSADHVERPPESLSPGERTRATLAVLQARNVNLLVVDEPTNHLDLPAIEQLEEALTMFEGTLVLVTHDRRLRDATECERRLDVVEGKVTEGL